MSCAPWLSTWACRKMKFSRRGLVVTRSSVSSIVGSKKKPQCGAFGLVQGVKAGLHKFQIVFVPNPMGYAPIAVNDQYVRRTHFDPDCLCRVHGLAKIGFVLYS